MKPNLRNVTLTTLVCLSAGGSGFSLGRMQTPWSAQAVPSLEYFIPPPTFSEIENAKGILEAASSRLIMQVRLARRPGLSSAGWNESHPALSPAGAIAVLEQGIKEFKGTGEEFRLVQELLLILKNENRYDRWLDLYLETLRRQPTHELIGENAVQAVEVASAVGREHELGNTFRVLARVAPVPSVTPRIRKVMASLDTDSQSTMNRDRNPCHL